MSLIKNSKELKNASLLVILGPTASGKTDISLRLAKELEGEIISADSLQIYKEFDIGSAKPDERQLKTVKHHLIGTISPKTELNAFDYSTMARQSIKEVVSKGRFPILVGGSGLYVRAVLDGLLKVEGSFKGVRQSIIDEIKTKGLKFLYEELVKSDPDSAKHIHFNDEMRIIRALELFRVTKKSRKEIAKSAIPLDIGSTVLIGLNLERKELYSRINDRVDKMLSAGLLNEVKTIVDKYGFEISQLNGLGYRQFADHLKGLITFEKAVYLTKMNTRHYAKRQITWFKKDPRVNWVDAKEDIDILLRYIISKIKEKKCL